MLIMSQCNDVLVNSNNITAFSVKAQSDFDNKTFIEKAYYAVYANKFLLGKYCSKEIAIGQLDKIMMGIAGGEKTYQMV